jgi:hypothetical protein
MSNSSDALVFSPITLSVSSLQPEYDMVLLMADNGQPFTLVNPGRLKLNILDLVVGDSVYATIDQHLTIHRVFLPGTPECRLDFIMQAMACRFPVDNTIVASCPLEERYLAAIDKLLELEMTSPRYTLVGEILAKCYEADQYDGDRSLYQVLTHATSELGETAEEVNIHMGNSYKTKGSDGVIGEAIDTISVLIDLIYLVNPNITEAELAAIASTKCQKWINNIKANRVISS